MNKIKNPRINIPDLISHRIVWFGVGLGVIYWFMESIIHTFLLHKGRLIHQLIPRDPNELLTRLFLFFLIISFGAYTQFIINKRNQAEEALSRVNRALKMLSKCNEVVVRATDESNLLKEVCQLIVEVGGYRLAWVGYAEHDPKMNVRPVAQAGFEEGYLKTFDITWSDRKKGRGPTGTAIRTGKLSLVRNILTDHEFTPWRTEATKRGYASSIALPLTSENVTFGALNIYAAETDAFDAREVELLIELAEDLGYGIVALRTSFKRKQVKEELRESEKKFRTLSESIQAIPYRYNIEQDQFTYIGKQVEKILGYSVDSWTDLESWSNRIHHDDREAAINYCLTAYKEGNDHNFEYRCVTSIGETVWIHDTVTVRKDENGSPVELVGFMVDITERKQAEEEIRLLLTMTQAIDEAEDFNSALEITLRKVCEATKWDYGEAWIPQSDGTKLEYCPVGYCSTESLEEFRRLSQGYTFTPGKGLPGRVWSSKHPEWVPDVSAEAKTLFMRSKDAREAGLKAALGVPIIIDNEVLAVLAFFMHEYRKEEKHLIELISTVAAQLGSVIQRKQGEEALTKSEEKFRGMVNQSNDGIYVLKENRFVLINSRFTEITGFELDEISAENFDFKELVAEEGLKVLEEREEMHKRGEKVPGRYVFKGLRKDGREVDLDVSVTSIDWEGAPAVLGTVRDVTKRIEARKKLEEALQSAKQANSVKSLFMANMSHEIRTPLNAILGFTDILETCTNHLISEEEKGYFNTIRNSGNRLMDTVHEILDISQIEAGTYELKLEHLDLVNLVRNMIRECQTMADNKGLKMEYTSEIDSAFIKVDQYGVTQAISNIIDNAIKYTEQGEINILLKQLSKQYVLTIQDTGIGIAEEYLESLFDAFSQESEGYTKKYQGIGLGMTIAKRHLDLNTVDIDVESAKGVGTTFTLTFKPTKKPLHKKKQIKQKEAKIKPIAEAVDKPLVLLVEDDPGSRKLTEFFLKAKYDIYFAVSVKEAKQQLKKYPIDLILLDLSLVGNEDGLDLVRWMRKTKTWKKIPVIATTAHAFTTDQNNCLVAGCNDYLPKPIKREKLLEKISEYV